MGRPRLIGNFARLRPILPSYRNKSSIAHSFLELRDGDGNIISQIHSAALNIEQQKIAPLKTPKKDYLAGWIKSELTRRFNAITQPNANTRLTAYVGKDLQVAQFLSSNTDYSNTVIEGTQEDVEEKWKRALGLCDIVNSRDDISFNPVSVFLTPGQTCNSLIASALVAMNVDPDSFESNFVRPGWGRRFMDLIDKIPLLETRSREEMERAVMDNEIIQDALKLNEPHFRDMRHSSAYNPVYF